MQIYIFTYIYRYKNINTYADEPDMQDTAGEAGTNS